jgi:hypothetical protein
MAVRGVDVEEEKKSYGSVFLLGAILLVVVGLWAVYDDNFTRRPWKKYQAEFYRLDYQKANAAYKEEDKKVKADASFQELVKTLEGERASLSGGELANKLSELRRQEIEAEVRFGELDQEVKFIKSKLEAAWYEYDHAVQTDGSIRPYEKRIEELNREKEEVDPLLEEARQRREQIKKEKKEIESRRKELEGKLSMLVAKRDRWNQVMDNATLIRLGSLSFLNFTTPQVPLFKIPSITQVVLPEFDRNNFDEPVARVDRCQTCHMAINRAGFEKEPNPFRTHPRREVLLADNAHPPGKFGCTACHQGEGAAVNSMERAHGGDKYWEHPLLRGAKVQSSCASCHLDVQSLEDAPLLAKGQRLFEQVGCTGCHLVEGYEDIPKVGRALGCRTSPSRKIKPWPSLATSGLHPGKRERSGSEGICSQKDTGIMIRSSSAGGKSWWSLLGAGAATVLPRVSSLRSWVRTRTLSQTCKRSLPRWVHDGPITGLRTRAVFLLPHTCLACVYQTAKPWL